MIRFTLDGRSLEAEEGETLLQAALRQQVEIPHLCHREGLSAAGNCRACMVEIEGEGRLAAACARRAEAGMVVRSASPRARRAQRGVVELLLADLGGESAPGELGHWARWLGLEGSRFAPRPGQAPDRSHPAIHFDPAACIRCTRCLRACHELQGNDVIGLAGRGDRARIVFDLDDSLGDSSCVACGECVAACPTGALLPADPAARQPADRQQESLCPWCGVGCRVRYRVKAGRIIGAEGADGPANRGRLCVKGRYGFDYVHHPGRLTRPLIRLEGAPKSLALEEGADPRQWFREAGWDEALEVAASGLARIRETHGGRALAGFGSAKGSNEEAYLFQKLVRCGFGSNNVDHCTRLCHASSVAALLEMIGSGAVSNPVEDVALADVILVVGSNTTENHPVAATFMKQAVRNGARLIVMDPRRTALARHARHFLQFLPGSDPALFNAILHSVIRQGLVDEAFVARRTRGYPELARHLEAFAPEAVAPLCGVPAGTIHEVARLYGSAGNAMIFWGMGVSQHVHGTDNVRCLIDLALITGQIGRPGTGLHPLRGQNNVQGASDAGLIPMVFPDYRRVDDTRAREALEDLWGCRLDPEPGLTVVEIMHAARRGEIRGLYVMGENPAMSDPDLHHTRAALAGLEHLVVQDLFLTETAAFADVVLPAAALVEKGGTFTNTDRRVQLARPVVEPPGAARQDLAILQELARRLGLAWDYPGPRQVFEEMRRAMPSIAGITWERLEAEGSVTHPCRREGDPGEAVLFTRRFPTADGRGWLRPVSPASADELPDERWPLVLITGRLLEHWHTGAMSRRAAVLERLQPRALARVHPDTLAGAGLASGERARLCSRRGCVELEVVADERLQPGQVFLPFCYREAAANLLTNPALDPWGKIPEYKFCAVRLEHA